MKTAQATTATGYAFDQAWEEENRRLAALTASYDEGTIRHLRSLGVSAGWRSWEVGAGTGTIARWLSAQVGIEGHVLATDLDTRFVDSLAGENVDVQRHDVITGPPEAGFFDVVHARALLMHLPERKAALDNMVAALRPGGTILAEDLVLPPPACDRIENAPLIARTLAAIGNGFRSIGADPDHGIRLPKALATAGLTDVQCDARIPIIAGGSRAAEFLWLTLEHLGGKLVAAGLLTANDVRDAIDMLTTPGTNFIGPIMVAAWGRRP